MTVDKCLGGCYGMSGGNLPALYGNLLTSQTLKMGAVISFKMSGNVY